MKGRFKLIDWKRVFDFDGFITDYAWYFDFLTSTHVFVFGDMDVYSPYDGYYDFETISREEAFNWFTAYDGLYEE